MFIQTESTPNPDTLKFLPGIAVMDGGTADFRSAEAADNSPLASALFTINHVTGVFFGSDFVTITKAESAEWSQLKPAVLTTLMEHFVSGKPVMGKADAHDAADDAEFKEEDAELVKQIRELLDTRVRPAVAMDGGDIIFRGYMDGIVKLELHGACSGCPSSTITLKHGIENMLKHYVPEIQSVEQVA